LIASGNCISYRKLTNKLTQYTLSSWRKLGWVGAPSHSRSLLFEYSVAEEQKVVDMTKRKCHLLEMGPLLLKGVDITKPKGAGIEVSFFHLKNSPKLELYTHLIFLIFIIYYYYYFGTWSCYIAQDGLELAM
jgi:hypothetical protein